MDRETKLRRLNDFRRSKAHCSAAALAQILTDIRKNGLPDLTDRNSMREARNLITSTPGTYGPVVKSIECEDVDGNPQRIPISCPFAALAAAMSESPGCRKFVTNRLRKNPPTPEKPWNIIMYSDEVTPGNPLATMNHRKFHAVYWTFLEFGATTLSHEEGWFPLTTEFSTTNSQVA